MTHGLHVHDLTNDTGRWYQAGCQCGWRSDVAPTLSAVVEAHRKHAREMEDGS